MIKKYIYSFKPLVFTYENCPEKQQIKFKAPTPDASFSAEMKHPKSLERIYGLESKWCDMSPKVKQLRSKGFYNQALKPLSKIVD